VYDVGCPASGCNAVVLYDMIGYHRNAAAAFGLIFHLSLAVGI